MIRSIAIITLCLLFGSCNSLNSVIKAKSEGKGTTETYEIGMDDAWEVAKKAFRWGGSDAIEAYKEEGYMLTSSGMNLVSSGAVMGAWVESVDATHTKVTVITKRRIATQIATTLTEGTYHKYFKVGVDYVKQGKKLPIDAPELN